MQYDFVAMHAARRSNPTIIPALIYAIFGVSILAGCGDDEPTVDAGADAAGGLDGGAGSNGESRDAASDADRPDGRPSGPGSDDAGGSTGDGGGSTSTSDGGGSSGTGGGGGASDGGDADDGGSGDGGAGGSGEGESTGGDPECIHDTQCGTAEWCRAGECVTSHYCLGDDDCPGGLVCDPMRQLCTVCADDDDCPAAERCVEREACVPYEACVNSLGCSGGQVCDTERGECVRCTVDADCEDGGVCAESACHPACESDLDCTAEGLLCRRDHVDEPDHCAECTDHVDCAPEQHCDRGTCAPDVCEAGEQRCGLTAACIPLPVLGGETLICESLDDPACSECGALLTLRVEAPAILVCDAAGSGFELASMCASGNEDSCLQGGGVATCEPRVCEPGTTGCDGESAMYSCSAAGLEERHRECPGGEVCAIDSCQPVICEVDTRRCGVSHPEMCTAQGTEWSPTETCTASEYCGPDTMRCLGTEASDHLGGSVGHDWELHTEPTVLGNVLLATDDRVLERVEIVYRPEIPWEGDGGLDVVDDVDGGGYVISDFPITLFVFREVEGGSFERVFELAARTVDVCEPSSCRFDPGVALEADTRYLIGAHVVPNEEGTAPRVGIWLNDPAHHWTAGYLLGHFLQTQASPPGTTYALPTVDADHGIAMEIHTTAP